MTLFEIVGLYVALNSLLLVILTYRVGTVRLKEKIYLGSDDNFRLQKRIRAQGNYIEFAPIALIGLFMLACLNAVPLVLHLFGAGFLIGRILHAAGMDTKNALGKGRKIGMIITILTLIGQAANILFLIFS